MSENKAIGTATNNIARAGVLAKLIAFSLALGVAPLGSYYGSLHYIWGGNATFAAITAVVAANIVLVAYIISSLIEDRQVAPAAQEKPGESRKDR